MLIFDQGKFVPEKKATVNARNKALNYGLGCFEGIRAFWNEDKQQLFIFRVRDHYKRFENSGEIVTVFVPFTVDELIRATIKLLRINKIREDVYIRPLCINGENSIPLTLFNTSNRVFIFATPLDVGKQILKLSISSWRRNSSNAIAPQAKATGAYMNSALASSEAQLAGFDDAIFLNQDGKVVEAPTDNIFIVKNNTLFTPPISDDVLKGITRDTVIKIAEKEFGIKTIIKSLVRSQLYTADEVFITGTATGIKTVVQIDERTIGTGKEGPVTRKIKDLYNQIVRGNVPKYKFFLTPVYKKR
ncbi:branched-chain amino acid transaminase [Chengkuizengella sediminis]|uniref:branched-chain amino acid transaminase n=1 Tax=Chengkuizengella sediminis TaxID=1885917 RepID=UPI001F0D058D|nr:branched-chain amino acid transaminase [Chengkuizengella sediminis]